MIPSPSVPLTVTKNTRAQGKKEPINATRSETLATASIDILVFAISLLLVLRFLATGHGYDVATLSILIKSLLLFTIMVTGAIWEKVVFGQYLFAPAFFWEDVFSFAVIALHGLYLWALWSQALAATELMLLALAAYTAYVINAGQFLWKLRRARLDLAPRSEGVTA